MTLEDRNAENTSQPEKVRFQDQRRSAKGRRKGDEETTEPATEQDAEGKQPEVTLPEPGPESEGGQESPRLEPSIRRVQGRVSSGNANTGTRVRSRNTRI